MITLELLMSRLSYDRDTGIFSWLSAPNYYTVGSVAGILDMQGYRRISIDGRLYKAHRLAWMPKKSTTPATPAPLNLHTA